MAGNTSKVSKFLSFVLRHKPEACGLTLDSGGWVSVEKLLQGMDQAGYSISVDELLQIVAESDKGRFTLASDGSCIRAAQGHSVVVDLELAPVMPPYELFHGTATTNVEAIVEQGLKPGRRQHVHLSVDQETALRVGQRHGTPVVLRIDAAQMHAAGHCFWRSDNGVWLTDAVPPAYIQPL